MEFMVQLPLRGPRFESWKILAQGLGYQDGFGIDAPFNGIESFPCR